MDNLLLKRSRGVEAGPTDAESPSKISRTALDDDEEGQTNDGDHSDSESEDGEMSSTEDTPAIVTQEEENTREDDLLGALVLSPATSSSSASKSKQKRIATEQSNFRNYSLDPLGLKSAGLTVDNLLNEDEQWQVNDLLGVHGTSMNQHEGAQKGGMNLPLLRCILILQPKPKPNQARRLATELTTTAPPKNVRAAGHVTTYDNVAGKMRAAGLFGDQMCPRTLCMFYYACRYHAHPLVFKPSGEKWKTTKIYNGVSWSFDDEHGVHTPPPPLEAVPNHCVFCEINDVNRLSHSDPIAMGWSKKDLEDMNYALNMFSVIVGRKGEFCKSSMDKPSAIVKGDFPYLNVEKLTPSYIIPGENVKRALTPGANIPELLARGAIADFIPSGWQRFCRWDSAEEMPFNLMRPLRDMRPFRHLLNSEIALPVSRYLPHVNININGTTTTTTTTTTAAAATPKTPLELLHEFKKCLTGPFSAMVEFLKTHQNFPECFVTLSSSGMPVVLDMSSDSAAKQSASSSSDDFHFLLTAYISRAVLCPKVVFYPFEPADKDLYEQVFAQANPSLISVSLFKNRYPFNPTKPFDKGKTYYYYLATMIISNLLVAELECIKNVNYANSILNSKAALGVRGAMSFGFGDDSYLAAETIAHSIKKLDPLINIMKEECLRLTSSSPTNVSGVIKEVVIPSDDDVVKALTKEGSWKHPDYVFLPLPSKDLKDHTSSSSESSSTSPPPQPIRIQPSLFEKAWQFFSGDNDRLLDPSQEGIWEKIPRLSELWGDLVSPLASWLTDERITSEETSSRDQLIVKGLQHLVKDLGLEQFSTEGLKSEDLHSFSVIASVGLRCLCASELHDIIRSRISEIVNQIAKLSPGDSAATGSSIGALFDEEVKKRRAEERRNVDCVSTTDRLIYRSAKQKDPGLSPDDINKSQSEPLEDALNRALNNTLTKEAQNSRHSYKMNNANKGSHLLDNLRSTLSPWWATPVTTRDSIDSGGVGLDDGWLRELDLRFESSSHRSDEKRNSLQVQLNLGLTALLDLKIFIASHCPLLSATAEEVRLEKGNIETISVFDMTNYLITGSKMTLMDDGLDAIVCDGGPACYRNPEGCVCKIPNRFRSENQSQLGPCLLEIFPCLPELVSSERIHPDITSDISRILDEVSPPVVTKSTPYGTPLRCLSSLFEAIESYRRHDNQGRDYWFGKYPWLMDLLVSLICGHMKMLPTRLLPLSELCTLEYYKSRRQNPPFVLRFRKGNENDPNNSDAPKLGSGRYVNPQKVDPRFPNITWSTGVNNPEDDLDTEIDGLSGCLREFSRRYPSLIELCHLLTVVSTLERSPYLMSLLRRRNCAPETYLNAVKGLSLEISLSDRFSWPSPEEENEPVVPLSSSYTKTKLEEAEWLAKSLKIIQTIMKNQGFVPGSMNSSFGLLNAYITTRLNAFGSLMTFIRRPGDFASVLMKNLIEPSPSDKKKENLDPQQQTNSTAPGGGKKKNKNKVAVSSSKKQQQEEETPPKLNLLPEPVDECEWKNLEGLPILTRDQQTIIDLVASLSRRPGLFEPALLALAVPIFNQEKGKITLIKELMVSWLMGSRAHVMKPILRKYLSPHDVVVIYNVCLSLSVSSVFQTDSHEESKRQKDAPMLTPTIAICKTTHQIKEVASYPHGVTGVMLDMGLDRSFKCFKNATPYNRVPLSAKKDLTAATLSKITPPRSQEKFTSYLALRTQSIALSTAASSSTTKTTNVEGEQLSSAAKVIASLTENVNLDRHDLDQQQEDEMEEELELSSDEEDDVPEGIINHPQHPAVEALATTLPQFAVTATGSNQKAKHSGLAKAINQSSTRGPLTFYSLTPRGEFQLRSKESLKHSNWLKDARWDSSTSVFTTEASGITPSFEGGEDSTKASTKAKSSKDGNNPSAAALGIDLDTLDIANPALISTCDLCFKFFSRDRLAVGNHNGVRCVDCRRAFGSEYLIGCGVCGNFVTLNGMTFQQGRLGNIYGQVTSDFESSSTILETSTSTVALDSTPSGSKQHAPHLSALAVGTTTAASTAATRKILTSSFGLPKALGLDVKEQALRNFARSSCGLSSQTDDTTPAESQRSDTIKIKQLPSASWVVFVPDEGLHELRPCPLCKACTRRYEWRFEILLEMAHRLTYQQFLAAIVSPGGHHLFE